MIRTKWKAGFALSLIAVLSHADEATTPNPVPPAAVGLPSPDAGATLPPSSVKIEGREKPKVVEVQIPEKAMVHSCPYSEDLKNTDPHLYEGLKRADSVLKRVSSLTQETANDLQINLSKDAPAKLTPGLDGMIWREHNAYAHATRHEQGLYGYMQSQSWLDSGWTPGGMFNAMSTHMGFQSAESLYGLGHGTPKGDETVADAYWRSLQFNNGRILEAYPAAIGHLARQKQIDARAQAVTRSVVMAAGLAASVGSFGTLTAAGFTFVSVAQTTQACLANAGRAAGISVGTALFNETVLSPIADSIKAKKWTDPDNVDEQMAKLLSEIQNNESVDQAHQASKTLYESFKDASRSLRTASRDTMDDLKYDMATRKAAWAATRSQLTSADEALAGFEEDANQSRSATIKKCNREISDLAESLPDSFVAMSSKIDLVFAQIVQKKAECLAAMQLTSFLEMRWLAKLGESAKDACKALHLSAGHTWTASNVEREFAEEKQSGKVVEVSTSIRGENSLPDKHGEAPATPVTPEAKESK